MKGEKAGATKSRTSVQSSPILTDELLISHLQTPNRRLKPCDLAAASASLQAEPIKLRRDLIEANAAEPYRKVEVEGERMIEHGSTADPRGSKRDCVSVAFVNGSSTMDDGNDGVSGSASHFDRLERALEAVAQDNHRRFFFRR